jgi:uncharacterized membrane protein
MAIRYQDAKHPRTALAGPYGHPFHPILVTLPIGAWVCSLVFDIASRFVDKPGALALGSEWLIAIGVLGALAAAAFGLLDLLAIPRDTRAFRIGIIHMGLNLLVTLAYAVNFFWRYRNAVSDGTRVDVQMVVVAAVSLAFLGVSGYLGGMLAYRFGVRVADEVTQREGFNPDVEAPRSSQPRLD